jgi:hypothetical protein
VLFSASQLQMSNNRARRRCITGLFAYISIRGAPCIRAGEAAFVGA